MNKSVKFGFTRWNCFLRVTIQRWIIKNERQLQSQEKQWKHKVFQENKSTISHETESDYDEMQHRLKF